MAPGLLIQRGVRRAILFLLLAPMICKASENGAVLDEINLARTQPRHYAAIVEERMRALPGADPRCVTEAEAFLMRQEPLDPLQTAPGLVESARMQADDQAVTGEIGHRSSDGSTPFSRMARTGQWMGHVGENISYGYADARSIVVTLIVDQGVPGRGHRRNIFPRDYRVAGAACGPHARWGAMCVIDFAGGIVERGDAGMVAWREEGW